MDKKNDVAVSAEWQNTYRLGYLAGKQEVEKALEHAQAWDFVQDEEQVLAAEVLALRATLARVEALPAKWQKDLAEFTNGNYSVNALDFATLATRDFCNELEVALKDKNNGSLPQTDRDAPSPVGPRPEQPEQELEPE